MGLWVALLTNQGGGALLFFSTSPIAANKNRVITTKNTKNAMRRFSAASKQVLLLPLLRNFAPEKNASDAYNMVFLALLINWGGSTHFRTY